MTYIKAPFLLVLALATTAAAQTPQEAQQKPVVVTARKFEELQSDVPQSVSSITAEQIQNAGIFTVKQAARFVPNTVVTEFSSRRLSFPFIRGVGSGQGDPAVATFIDGVPQLEVSSTNLPIFDVERIEILRGPHGALYGRNTIGGAIQILTKLPSNRLTFDSGITIGNFGLQDYRASVSIPVTEDKLFVSVAALHDEREGYSKNDATGNDVDDRDSWFGRAQLLWLPDSSNEVRLTVYGEAARDGGFVLSNLAGLRTRPHRINQDFEGSTDRDLASATLSWKHQGDTFDFTSITALQDWDIEETSDFDFSTIDGIRRDTRAEQTYVTQEVRFASPEDGEIRLTDNVDLRWLVGASGFISDSEQMASNEFRPGGAGILFPAISVGTDRSTGSFDSHSLAVFGQAAFTICDVWEATGALRYEYEARDADIDRVRPIFGASSSSPDDDYDEVLPRVSIAWRPCEDFMAYGLAARGFKAGGFNLTAPSGSEVFKPEKSWNYELGVRGSCCEDRLSASAAVFYIDWDDMQLSQFSTTSGGYVVNAGKSRSRGVELEARGKPIDELEIYGSIGCVDTEFTSFTDLYSTNVAGNDLPFAPAKTANVGGQYTMEVDEEHKLFARADYFHVGRFHYDPGNRAEETYWLANFRIGGGGKNWRVDFWLNNAFDEEYVPVAFQPSPFDATTFVGESAAPRTYGFTVQINF